MGTLFLKAEVDDWEPGTYNNKSGRVQQLLRYMRNEVRMADKAAANALELCSLQESRGGSDRGSVVKLSVERERG